VILQFAMLALRAADIDCAREPTQIHHGPAYRATSTRVEVNASAKIFFIVRERANV
jgi:hypothetical protein